MSNQVCANVNKVTNIVTKDSYFEIIISDNYNSGSMLISEDKIPKTDIEALQYLKDYGSDESTGICDVVDAILEYRWSIFINGTNYSWEEIKHIFDIEEKE